MTKYYLKDNEGIYYGVITAMGEKMIVSTKHKPEATIFWGDEAAEAITYLGNKNIIVHPFVAKDITHTNPVV